MLLFALVFILTREARAQQAAGEPPAESQVALQTCTALLTSYGQVPFCTTQVVDSAEFERQIEAYFTNGAGVTAMPETGPGAAYFHDAARVLALPTQNWGIASSPVIAPASSETATATSMPPPAAASVAPAPAASTTAEAERLQQMMAQAQEMISRAREVMAQAQETASRAQEAASRAEERASRAEETAPPRSTGEAPRAAETRVETPTGPSSDIVSQPTIDPKKVVVSSAREPAVAEGRATHEPMTATQPLRGRNLDPLWAVLLAGGLIAAGLIYVVATLVQRHHRPLHGRHV